jgi:prepilin-type N-terminal cleavage/methylation domain-containing protein
VLSRLPAMPHQSIATRFALRFVWALQSRRSRSGSSTVQGFTLIEALVAIVIISITLVSITPPIILATATRIQNRRAQQAVQIAQGEIDRIRVLVERQQPNLGLSLPPSAGNVNIRARNVPAAPSGTSFTMRTSATTCSRTSFAVNGTTVSYTVNNGTGTPPASGFLVDSNGDCEPDFIVQTFRGFDTRSTATAAIAGSPPDGFVMGVRVYSIVAAGNTLETEQAGLRATSGLGSQTTRPLAVLYGTIVRNNSSSSVEIYRQLCPLGGGGC